MAHLHLYGIAAGTIENGSEEEEEEKEEAVRKEKEEEEEAVQLFLHEIHC